MKMVYLLIAAASAAAIAGVASFAESVPPTSATAAPAPISAETRAMPAGPVESELGSAIEGDVLELIDVPSYSYLRLGVKGTAGTWVAVSTASLEVGYSFPTLLENARVLQHSLHDHRACFQRRQPAGVDVGDHRVLEANAGAPAERRRFSLGRTVAEAEHEIRRQAPRGQRIAAGALAEQVNHHRRAEPLGDGLGQLHPPVTREEGSPDGDSAALQAIEHDGEQRRQVVMDGLGAEAIGDQHLHLGLFDREAFEALVGEAGAEIG